MIIDNIRVACVRERRQIDTDDLESTDLSRISLRILSVVEPKISAVSAETVLRWIKALRSDCHALNNG